MKKLFIILGYEFRTVLRRPSYLFFAFGLPLAVLGVLLVINLTRGNEANSDSSISEPDTALKPEGFVDYSGLVKFLPPDIPEHILTAYVSEDMAKQALNAGEITAYYVIPADYVIRGEFNYFRSEYNVLTEEGQQGLIRWTLLYNMAGGDLALAQRLGTPTVTFVMDLSVIEGTSLPGTSAACPNPGFRCDSSVLLRYLPLFFLVIFFIAILSGSSLILYGVAGEKENRIMEVLLTSSSPRQLLGGKILGFGLLGLIQTCAWIGTALLSMVLGADTLSVPEGFTLPLSILAWAGSFFLFGFAVYAGLMAAAGALLPDIKSFSGVTMIMASPSYVAYMATIFLSGDPHGLLATGLSIFPLTSPLVMMWRLVQGGVAIWQPVLALVLLAVTAIFVIRSAAGIFSARELLSGQPFQLRRYLKLLVGQA